MMYKWKKIIAVTLAIMLVAITPVGHVFAQETNQTEINTENSEEDDKLTEDEEAGEGTSGDEISGDEGSGNDTTEDETSDSQTNDGEFKENEGIDDTSAGDISQNNLEPVQEELEQQNVILEYRAHVQNIGWQDWVSNGTTAGTTGRGYRVEALQIRLVDLEGNSIENLHIEYRAHVENIGWQDWVKDGETTGTTGAALRVEAMQIRIVGDDVSQYSLYFRAHVSNIGWQGYAGNDGYMGSEALAEKMEAVEILLRRNDMNMGENAIVVGQSYVRGYQNSELTCAAHVQNIGGISGIPFGNVAGTTGQGLRIEGLTINMNPASELVCEGNIEYSSHIENIGWTDYVSSGTYSGTTGRGLRMEAIKIRLTGQLAQYYNIYYRVHAQNFGWMGWAVNGQAAGSSGYAYRLEALQIKLVPKSAAAPGTNIDYFRDKATVDSFNIARIRSYVGRPYVSGGTTPNGWDCSGCTQWIYQNIYGISFPRTTYQQVLRGYAIDKNNINAWQPGDLICFGNSACTHVGIYLGNGEMIHALGTKYGTRIDGVLWYDSWDSGVRLLAVRRVF